MSVARWFRSAHIWLNKDRLRLFDCTHVFNARRSIISWWVMWIFFLLPFWVCYLTNINYTGGNCVNESVLIYFNAYIFVFFFCGPPPPSSFSSTLSFLLVKTVILGINITTYLNMKSWNCNIFGNAAIKSWWCNFFRDDDAIFLEGVWNMLINVVFMFLNVPW